MATSAQSKTKQKIAIITAVCAGLATIIGAVVAGLRGNPPKPITPTPFPTQSTAGDLSPAITAGRDVSLTITQPETKLGYKAPTINSFRGYHNGSTFLILQDNRNVPITLTKEPNDPINGIWDYTVEFEVLNKSKADIKIKTLIIEVLKVDPIEPIKYYVPLAGLGEARSYTCRLDGRPGKYESEFGERGKYLFLRSGEQETIKIAINTMDEGRYSLRALLELSTVDGLKYISVGEVSDVRILKRAKAFTLPRER